MHILRWRRRNFFDEVLFDDRRVATSKGLFGRETTFGLGVIPESGDEVRFILSIDPEVDWNDWTGEARLKGVRLETANTTLIAQGSFGPDRIEPFRELYDRAIKAIGLS